MVKTRPKEEWSWINICLFICFLARLSWIYTCLIWTYTYERSTHCIIFQIEQEKEGEGVRCCDHFLFGLIKPLINNWTRGTCGS
jgi:hypothetical protein